MTIWNKLKYPIPTILILCGTTMDLTSQIAKEESKWYFGQRNALDFSSGVPVAITGCSNTRLEGSASIADAQGNLLFYMNPLRIWDASNRIMPNGGGLWGGWSSTMGALISPVLGNPNQYYAFTLDGFSCTADSAKGPLGMWDGLCYSIVDMSLSGNGTPNQPLGDVVLGQKNIPLVSNTAEKACVVPHANGGDYWVVTKEHGGDNVYAFLVTCAGINTTPVISTINAPDGWTGAGYLVSSKDGKILVNAEERFILMIDFDNNTGISTNTTTLKYTPLMGYYGVAYSPNDSIIYVGEFDRLFAYERFTANVPGSEQIIPLNVDNAQRALKLGPDNIIYISDWGDSTICELTNPNNIVNPGVSISSVPITGSGRMNFPNFYTSPIKSVDAGSTITICNGDSAQLGFVSSSGLYSWFPTTAMTDGTISNPKVAPTTTTTYYITTNQPGFCNSADSIIVIVDPVPIILISDTTICENDVVLFDAGNVGSTFLWSTGATTQTITTGIAGTYWITAGNGSGCSDSVGFSISTIPCNSVSASLSQSSDNLCFGDSAGSATISAVDGIPPYAYLWSPYGGNAATATALTAGTYSVDVWDANADTVVATVIINEATQITISSTSSPATCGNSDGSATGIPADGTPGYSYLWDASTGGQTTATATNLPAGNYDLTVTDANGCTEELMVKVSNIGGPSSSLSSLMNVICNGQSNGSATVIGFGGIGNLTYNWSPSGGNSTTATNLPAGTYTVTISDEVGCLTQQTVIVTEPTPITSSISTQSGPTCNGSNDGIATVTSMGGAGNYTYQWNPQGGTSSTGSGLSAGIFTITITDQNNCTSVESVFLTEPAPMMLSAIDAAVCENEWVQLTSFVSNSIGLVLYQWSPATGLNDQNISNPIFNSTGISSQSYTVTVADNCSTISQMMNISVNPMPAVVAWSDDASIYPSGSTTLHANGGVSYLWSPSNGLSDSTSADPTFSHSLYSGAASPLQYLVTVTGVNGCKGIDTVEISIDSEKLLFIPNIFSPDNNGINDFLRAYGKGIKDIVLTIYNRWGEQVFATNDLNQGWDGVINRKKTTLVSQQEVFYYSATATFYDDTEEIASGTITLVN